VVAVFAALVVVFDSWANRPVPVPARRPHRPVRPAAAPRSRPPVARPGGAGPRRAVPQPYYYRR